LLGGESLSAGSAAAVDKLAARCGFHASAEAELAFAADFGGLIGSFHVSSKYKIGFC
jgi:hypothetical protein